MPNIALHPKTHVRFVRIVIPKDARHAFDGNGEKWVSLHTRDDAVANQRGIPVIASIKRKIEDARVANQAHAAIEGPDAAFEAIERWGERAITDSYIQHFSRQSDKASLLGEEAIRRADLIYRLSQPRAWEHVTDFDTKLVEILRGAGISISKGHHALAGLRPAFKAAWHKVAHRDDQFRRGDFANAPDSIAITSASTPTPGSNFRLDDLLAEFLRDRARPAKDVSEMKTYVRRLKERIGDLPVQHITKAHLAEFKGNIWKFPKRLKKRHAQMTFAEILADVGDDPTVPRLKAKTVKKWLDMLSMVFNHGVSHGHMNENPTAGLKPRLPKRKSALAKLSYDADDIAAIFSSPIFTGCDRVHDSNGKVYGYREKPGTFLIKDTRYWLPLLGAWMGFRLEEAGGTPLADVKRHHGIDYLDLQERDLKTEGSKRLVPIHPKLIALGFLDYVARLRAAGETHLFPDLPHDDKAATRQFTKWWGYWSRANSKARGIEGEGFDDPRKSFHSFRHAFKRACRGLMTKEIHDLLTGHGDGSVSSDYGPGAELVRLAEAIAKVNYPTFPKLP